MEATIVIVERYPLLRKGLIQFLNQHFASSPILEYENVNELSGSVRDWWPMLVILGLNGDWPEEGLNRLSSVRLAYPNAKIIVYDEVTDHINAFEYLKGGAHGYISKTEAVANLINGINQVLIGKKYAAKDILEAIFEDHIFGRKIKSNYQQQLTHNEFSVANYLINGMTTKRVASILHKNVATVNTFKRKIFEKLDVTNVAELEAKLRTKRK